MDLRCRGGRGIKPRFRAKGVRVARPSLRVFVVSLASEFDTLYSTTMDIANDLGSTLSPFSPGLLKPIRYVQAGLDLCCRGKDSRGDGIRPIRIDAGPPVVA